MKSFSQIEISPRTLHSDNPKIGLITLSTDFTIEKDFHNICQNKNVNIFVNRIPFDNPLNHKNYLKMVDHLSVIANNILPGIKLDSIAYGCTSGSVAIGDKVIIEEIRRSKENAYVTTPMHAAIKAFKKMKIKKIAVLTPYPAKVNKTIFDHITKENFEITSFHSFNLQYDSEIASVDPKFIFETIEKIKHEVADAIFISCTALRAVEVLDQIEQQIAKPVISSNQAMTWDCLRAVGVIDSIKGYGELFSN